jgi:anti-anti-sigma factor
MFVQPSDARGQAASSTVASFQHQSGPVGVVRHATIVVDMTRTRFCDSAGFSVLVAAQTLAEGGGLRLVIPDGSRVLRVFTVIGLVRFIPRFASLDRALPPGPAAAG